MSMISQFQGLWKMFIRPARQEYSKGDLGHETSVFGKYKSKRTDCVILNKKSQKLQCSLFEPISLENDNHQSTFPCVIYCHCSSGSRLEALRLLPQIIQQGMGLFCFDFSGSGLSEGEYVTLGINESHDLECVVNYLVSCGKVSNIALWGRSMGAVTCILYMGMKTKHNAVKAIVFDSGFSNMNQLTLDLAKQKTGMPNMLIEPALYLVNDQVRERVNVDIQSIDLAKTIHSIYVPIHFVCSKEDTFVKSDHSERLYDRYNGLKWIEHTTGGHNAHRPNELIDMLVDWTSYFVFDRKKPAFYQYIPKTTASAQTKEEEICQDFGESNMQNRRKSRILNSTAVNRGTSQTPETIQERTKILNESLAKSKQQCNDLPASPLKNIVLLGRQPNNSNYACSPTSQTPKQAAQVRVSQEMNPISGQNMFVFPQNYGKEGQYQQQQVDQQQQPVQQQQRGRNNAKILFEEKESLQLQSQDSVSSQTRLGTEETSSRNENTESQINMLSSRNASNNRSSNHNGYASNSVNNPHADSFLSSTNEEMNSNECPSVAATTPQRMHEQIGIQNYEFEDSPQIGKTSKNNNSRSVIGLTPQNTSDSYQRLSSNFNSFQVGGNTNINNTYGLVQYVTPLATSSKGSFLQASNNTVTEERKISGYPQEPPNLAARGQGTPQFNRDNKSQYSFFGGNTPSSTGSFKSDYQDSPNLPHHFPKIYAKNESQQNRHYSSSNICANLNNTRNHRNLSYFSIPKEIQINNEINVNQHNDLNNPKSSDSALITQSYQGASSSQPQLFPTGFKNINQTDCQRQSCQQLQAAQQSITNHQPFKSPTQSTLGSNRYQQIGDNNLSSSYRSTRSATCNGLIQFPGLSQGGNIQDNSGSNTPAANGSKNIEPSPYTPFFAQTVNSNKITGSTPSNSTPLQDTIRLRGLNTSIDFNIGSVPGQNTPKQLKVLTPSLRHAQTHLSFPSMSQVQSSNNQPISFASSSNQYYQHTNQYFSQTKEQPPPPVKVISLHNESQKQLQQQPVNNHEATNCRGITTNPLSQSFDRQKQPTPVVGINICSPKGAVSKTPEQSLYFASSQNNLTNHQNRVQFSNISSAPSPKNGSNLGDKTLPSISEVFQQRSMVNNSNKNSISMNNFSQAKEIQNINAISNSNSQNNLRNEKMVANQASFNNQTNFFSMPLQFFNTFDNSRDFNGGNGSFVAQSQQTQKNVAQTTSSSIDFSSQIRNKQFKQ